MWAIPTIKGLLHLRNFTVTEGQVPCVCDQRVLFYSFMVILTIFFIGKEIKL